jgi:hypothetical protein
MNMSRKLFLAPVALAFALALAACDEAGDEQSGATTEEPQTEAAPESTGETQSQ